MNAGAMGASRWETWLLGVPVRRLPALLPGVMAALAVALVARALASVLGAAVLRLQGLDGSGPGVISAISLAVVLGLVAGNVATLHPGLRPGLDFAVKKVLRLGIIGVGIKLSLVDVLRVGAMGVPVVATLVTFALVVTLAIARWAKVSRELGALAAASTAICGITATLAIAPSIEADEREVAYTVANVTLLGLFGMLVYPYLAHALFAAAPGAAGLFLGTAIHDTSQVMGAALSYRQLFADERAFEVATVAKLTRNALLIGVVPALAWLHARRAGGGERRVSLGGLLPVFVLGFLALSLVRTLGDLQLQAGSLALFSFDPAQWKALAAAVGEGGASVLLGTALAAVGLTTRLSVFRGLGPRPFLVGLAAAVVVGLASLALAALVGPSLG